MTFDFCLQILTSRWCLSMKVLIQIKQCRPRKERPYIFPAMFLGILTLAFVYLEGVVLTF